MPLHTIRVNHHSLVTQPVQSQVATHKEHKETAPETTAHPPGSDQIVTSSPVLPPGSESVEVVMLDPPALSSHVPDQNSLTSAVPVEGMIK